jgi:hypothetical protein
MNEQQLQRSHSEKYRAPPADDHYINNPDISSSLPDTFISSLRQLFTILDKTKSGYISFDVFKRYFDCTSSSLEFLNELEIESKSNNNLITFNLLINVIKRSLSFTKNPPPPPPPILVPTPKHPLNRSTSVLVVVPKAKKMQRQIPIAYRSSIGLDMNKYNASNPIYYNRNNQIDFAMV